MKKVIILFVLILAIKINAQIFSGEVFLRDNSILYLNQIYITNLTTQNTVLSDYNGDFKILANEGDIIRLTSIVTERKDIKLSNENLKNVSNFIELKIAYQDIQEIVINHFKASGNLRKDVNALKNSEKALAIQKMIGLPVPKGDGTSPELPVAGFYGGGLTFSLDAVYDLLSGERKKKERYYAYEKMNISIDKMAKYFGKDYFTKMKIPENLISNFLQFVYTSDNLSHFVDIGNFEATQNSMEKYLPIYQKRLSNSNLKQIITK